MRQGPTPETDIMASMQRTHREWQTHSENLERHRDELFLTAAQYAGDLHELRTAIREFRDAKGRYHTQIAAEKLIQLLPETKSPRLQWMETHGIRTYKNDYMSKPWMAIQGEKWTRGEDEEDALFALAKMLGIPTWKGDKQ